MKPWTQEQLEEWFTLLPDERRRLEQRTGANQLGYAVLLKWFQYRGGFPDSLSDVPSEVVAFLAEQLVLTPDLAQQYDQQGRTGRSHRADIMDFLGFRAFTVEDAIPLTTWLSQQEAALLDRPATLRDQAFRWCREQRLVAPTDGRLDRLVQSAIQTAENHWYEATIQSLSTTTRQQLENLLITTPEGETDGEQACPAGMTPFAFIRSDPGGGNLASILTEGQKLHRLRAITLPPKLFHQVSPKVVQRARRRVSAEHPSQIRAHPEAIRWTLLASFCWLRQREITDNLVDLLLAIIHRISTTAEKKVTQSLQRDIKRVEGKTELLFQIAEASLKHPEGMVQEVIYPITDGQQKLQDLVNEAELIRITRQQRLQKRMHHSYGSHYRRMVPPFLTVLSFRSNNATHRPVIQALERIQSYAGRDDKYFEVQDSPPLDGVVSPSWRSYVEETQSNGTKRVRRVPYELCALQALRHKLRCKEIWVVGADRYRNPDEDLPADFDRNRQSYYAALGHPLSATAFVAAFQEAMKTRLTQLDQTISSNPSVKIHPKEGGWIALSPFQPQDEPPNLTRLKAELERRWNLISLLDMLKEADLRIGFTQTFRSVASREVLDRATIQQRLLLCLYGLGTNLGLKRMCAGNIGVQADDWPYIRRRFITVDALRHAIGMVVNALFIIRDPAIWGHATTACASDSKKFGAWDQNLLTEWHARYQGPGVMIYWHVEKKSACIHSRLTRCSSSEVAAMIQGVLRHCTDMTIERQYVDSHGQSEIAFAFCRLLGFDLLPRLRPIHSQKLYRPEAGHPEAYPNLQLILTRPIAPMLIVPQYDEMIKFTTALVQGTADPEALLRRFQRTNVRHPTYRALAEFGKGSKTMFLCDYFMSEALRREIQEGLNVVESWNRANDVLFFGRGSEMATNRQEDLEVAMLCLHLLQICMVYVNTLLLQDLLLEPAWRNLMTVEDLRALTPLIYRHVNPYGLFPLDMTTRLPLTAC